MTKIFDDGEYNSFFNQDEGIRINWKYAGAEGSHDILGHKFKQAFEYHNLNIHFTSDNDGVKLKTGLGKFNDHDVYVKGYFNRRLGFAIGVDHKIGVFSSRIGLTYLNTIQLKQSLVYHQNGHHLLSHAVLTPQQYTNQVEYSYKTNKTALFLRLIPNATNLFKLNVLEQPTKVANVDISVGLIHDIDDKSSIGAEVQQNRSWSTLLKYRVNKDLLTRVSLDSKAVIGSSFQYSFDNLTIGGGLNIPLKKKTCPTTWFSGLLISLNI